MVKVSKVNGVEITVIGWLDDSNCPQFFAQTEYLGKYEGSYTSYTYNCENDAMSEVISAIVEEGK